MHHAFRLRLGLATLLLVHCLFRVELSAAGPPVLEPECPDQFYVYQEATETLAGLPQTLPRPAGRSENGGQRIATFAFKGNASGQRFSAGSDPVLVVRLGDRSARPENTIQWYRMEATADARLLRYQTDGQNRITKVLAETVAFRTEPFGAHSLRLIPNAPLAPGEYLLSTRRTERCFCFGVGAGPETSQTAAAPSTASPLTRGPSEETIRDLVTKAVAADPSFINPGMAALGDMAHRVTQVKVLQIGRPEEDAAGVTMWRARVHWEGTYNELSILGKNLGRRSFDSTDEWLVFKSSPDEWAVQLLR